jgi:hypothetical protein
VCLLPQVKEEGQKVATIPFVSSKNGQELQYGHFICRSYFPQKAILFAGQRWYGMISSLRTSRKKFRVVGREWIWTPVVSRRSLRSLSYWRSPILSRTFQVNSSSVWDHSCGTVYSRMSARETERGYRRDLSTRKE